jgi:hypothetical protein
MLFTIVDVCLNDLMLASELKSINSRRPSPCRLFPAADAGTIFPLHRKGVFVRTHPDHFAFMPTLELIFISDFQREAPVSSMTGASE